MSTIPNKVLIKQKERLMKDEEIYSEQELRERKRRIAAVMRMQDEELRKEQEEIEERGECATCHLVLTTTGECPIGH